jgi:hypothetical protein
MMVYCRNMYTTLNAENVRRSLSAPIFLLSSRRHIRVNKTCRGSPLVVLLFPPRTINTPLASVFLLRKIEHTVLGRRPVLFPTWTATITRIFTLFLSVPPSKYRTESFIRAQSLSNSLSQHHTPNILLGRYVVANA